MLLMRLHTAKAVDTGRLTTGGVPARRVIAQAHIQDHGMGRASGHVEFFATCAIFMAYEHLWKVHDERMKMKTKEVHISI